MVFIRTLLVAGALLVPIGWAGAPFAESQQQESWDGDFKPAPSPGKIAFNSTCAGCHGLDGRGSEKAPNIASSPKVQGMSDVQISRIVSNGTPGTGMPAFHTLTSTQVRSIVSYLRTLQGKGETASVPGNSARGKDIFFGKGECSSCHTVSGEGGFIGPDLTGYGGALTAKAIREGILNPNRIVPTGYRLAVATTQDGSRVEGVVRSEDNFSVQLQARDGGFHFFQKSDLKNLEHLDRSLMPTDYATRLSGVELDDLVKYLAAPGSSDGKPQPAGKSGESKE
jgi:putative heme-binding domain-containing protein